MDTSVKWPPIAGVMSFKLCAQISFYIENKTCQIRWTIALLKENEDYWLSKLDKTFIKISAWKTFNAIKLGPSAVSTLK